MDIDKLQELIQSGSDKLLSLNGYKALLNRGNNLNRFDVLNRILIYLQSESAFDIRTNEEWEILGRKVKQGEHPIYIIVPKYKTVYIETETNKEVTSSDLSVDETLKAIEYGIIRREDSLESMYTVPLYDVRQTLGNKESEYNVNKPLLTSAGILELLRSFTGATIELCDEDYYSKSENVVFIKKKPYNELASTVCDIIVKYIMNYKIDEIISTAVGSGIKDFSKIEKTVLENSLIYSLSTILATEISIDISGIQSLSYDKIIDMLNIVDVAITDIVKHMKFKNDKDSFDAIHSITKLHKAEVVLDIMEANNINKIMKGM